MEEHLAKTMMVYVHIPFCVQKCAYCDFLSFAADDALKEDYLRALRREIRERGRQSRLPVSSLFIGGGTPTVLSEKQLGDLLEEIFWSYSVEKDAEVTVEMNPGTVTPEKAVSLRKAGVNRVSMGVQSFDDGLLKKLGRIHDSTCAKESFHLLRKAGFDNLSMDLMSGLPGQSLATWLDTLRTAVSLHPEHLSCYSLILEEGTPFYEMKEQLLLPDEETERRMYHEGADYLSLEGYGRYEISNFALPGKESRHNSGYWVRRPYDGLGLGASSFEVSGDEQVRFHDPSDMKLYLDAWKEEKAPLQSTERDEKAFWREEVETLSRKDQMAEFMILGLRLAKGRTEQEFYETFGEEMRQVYGNVLEKHRKEGLLEVKGGRWYLTRRGVDVSNRVFVDFL